MGAATDRIEQHITAEREKLDRDLQLIERKARIEAQRFRRKSIVIGIVIGAAVFAAALLARVARR